VYTKGPEISPLEACLSWTYTGRGDQVFGECSRTNTGNMKSLNNGIPDDGFFPDIKSLYIDMADHTANVNTNLNVNPPATLYAIFSYLFQFLTQFLILEFGIYEICIS
jgi:hypothetical protein